MKYLNDKGLEIFCEKLKTEADIKISDFKLSRVLEEKIDLLFEK